MTDYPPQDPDLPHADELALDVTSTDEREDSLAYMDAEALASFNLRRIRAALGVSQQEIADRLTDLAMGPRLSQSQIAKIERGERPWKVNEMVAIAAALNLHFDEFFQGQGTAGALDLEIANARVRLGAVKYEEDLKREAFIEAKRKVREAEDTYLGLIAERGGEDAEALRILHFRYYVNEAKALEMETYQEMVDQDNVAVRSSNAEKWARAELKRLQDDASKNPRKPPVRDERFPDPNEWFAESIRKQASGERSKRDGPDYL